MILAGDIGGTKTILALVICEQERVSTVVEQIFKSKEYRGLENIIQEFLSSDSVKSLTAPIRGACFGVAGPVVDEISITSNLPWVIAVPKLRTLLNIETVTLINDLEATAYGIPTLSASELFDLNEAATSRTGNAALIAAGTGLGEAMLYWDGHSHHPIASEGGHGDFAPRDELEIELLKYLLKHFGHASYERVLSGPGLFNIYSFLRDSGYGDEPTWLKDALKTQDAAATITRAAQERKNELCVKTLDLFTSLYGAEAGNLALKFMALNGVYVGGGIAPKILDELRDGAFLKAFHEKGRLSDVMKTIPVRVIMNPKAALFGAARYAHLLVNEQK